MIEKKVALITGAAQGIGKEIAKVFAKNGAIVVLSDLDREKLQLASQELKEQNLKVDFYAADVSSEKDVEKMVEYVINKYSKLNFLINNAGISIKNPDNSKKRTVDIDEKEWDKIITNNLKSVFLCSKHAAKHMIKNNYGKIVNISSIVGKTGCSADKTDNYFPTSATSGSHYATSKAGIICFTKSLARELGKFNINVNVITPGAVSVGMGKFNSEVIDKMKTQIPLNRIASPVDIANSALFLCSDLSDYITGETINVNGGWLMD